MKRMIAAAAVMVAAGCATGSQQSASAPSGPAPSLAASFGYFGADLYRQLSSDEKDDLLISPASISAAFALAHAGARGDTAAEIRALLRYPESEDLHLEMGAFFDAIEIDEDERTSRLPTPCGLIVCL
jgi:serine protease inhibitor